jgi:mono/diheme cytochrome c family protein
MKRTEILHGITTTRTGSRFFEQRPRSESCRSLFIIAHIALIILQLISLSAVADEPQSQATSADLDFFEKQIRPLLAARCQECHGPLKQWAGLRLDSREAMLAGGDSGPAIRPGDKEQGQLLARVRSSDADLRMPPPEAGEPLTSNQINDLALWIAKGAAWPNETTTAKTKEELWQEHWAFQPLREVTPPTLSDPTKIRNDIDRFVQAKLQVAGLTSSPQASREVLIVRAYYDLCGLPPTQAEIRQFVNDSAENAYEELIERLLSSPRYGERWGRHWLDVARYSDTKGYVYGREERRFIHSSLYRDWVINAFNQDLPFDRFVMLQLAADQLTPDDPAAQAAMGFLTLGRRFLGTNHDIIDDRIDVVGRGLLGLTVGCARCHDHKYDPIPTADYYSLYGVFLNCSERQIEVPGLAEKTEAAQTHRQGLQERLEKLRNITQTARTEGNQRIRNRLKDYLLAQTEIEKYPEVAFVQLTSKDELLPAIVRRWHAFLAGAEHRLDPIFLPWIRFSKLSEEEFTARSAEVTRQLLDGSCHINQRVAKAFEVPPQSLTEVAERYASLLATVDQNWQASQGDLSKFDDCDRQLHAAFYAEGSPCVIPDEPIINTEWYWDNATGVELWKAQNEVDQWILRAPTATPCTVVLNDNLVQQDAYVFRRGNPAAKGERVPRQSLKLLAGESRQPFAKGSGRLELAEAIVNPTNPLTARVWVNRVWQHHFGNGLVRTASDFGIRATPPSHPELLDYLTSRFISGGWSSKSLHREIMLSATYRQSTDGPADVTAFELAQQRDPENQYLWRSKRRRLQFEAWRDSMLAASGELDVTMGGPGTDLFGPRRSVYVSIDRQFLPTLLSIFDFANPDLHCPERSETTTPQQALFALNHHFVAARAKKIVAGLDASSAISQLYEKVLGRMPSTEESRLADQYLLTVEQATTSGATSSTSAAWSYGYGVIDEIEGRLKSFTPLPYFTGSAWQGGPQFPDGTLGWVQLSATGGHPGNDRQHAIVRRWTAPETMAVSIQSMFAHDRSEGDGVRVFIVSSKQGLLKSFALQNRQAELSIDSLQVEQGETIDFVVDINQVLNNDQFLWSPKIVTSQATQPGLQSWDAEKDFEGNPASWLSPLEQLAQVLLISNERMFVP